MTGGDTDAPASPARTIPPRELSVWALPGIPEIAAGDNLVALILAAAAARPLMDGDILVVTSKIVSKAEGRLVRAEDREAAISAETARVVATRNGTRIVENRLGIVGAAAGVDASNVPAGTVLLLPEDPDRSARILAAGIRAAGPHIGVILSDTIGRPWREGQTDIAIGAAGVRVFDELEGTPDSAGRPLAVTRPCLADEIAAAGDLVKGKTFGLPVAVVRGYADAVGPLDLPGARSIIRTSETDMFRFGSDEAYAAGFAAGLNAVADTESSRS
ncbi:coenzyme F420-0:L-glutamate ligase [Arthrobacter sp. zg-Y859]|uniref:Coenzyme F420-0:L-glutamate ligase n=1 Tax=Arthrobacter jinronghuae TaxID=2964609 RepID=A0ABT1NPV8_9MICC|nr:coenzyme F420-0:L-glutamate ligase [Arthrobacter jinronghuae]MCQ1948764.1 coenzyme F420-0:L-glutamate ligase [Arthrobacter jinronghuae]UWX78424.1 coenzyme F420-0:L-glutamate ligase [Arthrobacter jinronghuae]